ncbi:MAG TPA: LysM peptidoglycan-binding domain-containing protein [Clostridia bacterium]|nr:LysM peptidoglycan-binding domain-containing protein [Clostridia bacterium]
MPYVIVQPGDTLRELSQRYHVSYLRLLAANPQIRNPDLIYPGQVVILPTPHQRTPAAEVQRVVRPGDTMYFIAREYGIPLDQLIAQNRFIKDPNLIYPGMIVTIRRGRPCPSQVVDFVNRFMQRKAHGQPHDHREFLTAEAEQYLDKRLVLGIRDPANTEYDFLSCYHRSGHEYVALVALYRRRQGYPGIYDIVVEHIIVRIVEGQPRVANINVQVVLQVS